MYEDYTRQSLPSEVYKELLGAAICVFNSNNGFIIKSILRYDDQSQYSWYELIDLTSGKLMKAISDIITKKQTLRLKIYLPI